MTYRFRADDMSLPAVIIILAIATLGSVGWIWNIIKLVGAVSEPLSAMFIIRCVGVFLAPLGAILGFL